jgi:hypothetical protein
MKICRFISLLGVAVLGLLSSAEAITFKVRTKDRTEQWYQLEVSSNLPAAKPAAAPMGAQANDYADAYGYTAHRKYPKQAAEMAAVGWAGGMLNNDPDPFKANTQYLNSGTILGGKKPGGFYNASDVKVDSTQYFTSPVPYYLVTMEGIIEGSRQTFYAAVLDDGRIVRPRRQRPVARAQGLKGSRAQ